MPYAAKPHGTGVVSGVGSCPALPCSGHPGRTYCPSVSTPGQCNQSVHQPCPPCKAPAPPPVPHPTMPPPARPLATSQPSDWAQEPSKASAMHTQQSQNPKSVNSLLAGLSRRVGKTESDAQDEGDDATDQTNQADPLKQLNQTED